MPTYRTLLYAAAVWILLPSLGFAQEPGFFAGLDTSVGIAQGSSGTSDGGAPFAGGSVISDVKFDHTTGIGGHFGYALDSSWSLFLSYQYVRSDIQWDASFPNYYGAASHFSGKAVSNTVLANVGYDVALTDAFSFRATAGLGVAFNSLSDVTETDQPTSLFLSDVADHTESSPAAQLGVGLRYALARNTVIGLDAAVAYVGDFRTGDERTGSLGVTEINPYKIDDVWRESLGASIEVSF